jgi:hypothetical protein
VHGYLLWLVILPKEQRENAIDHGCEKNHEYADGYESAMSSEYDFAFRESEQRLPADLYL